MTAFAATHGSTTDRDTRYRVLSVVVAGVLLAAACLKLAGLNVTAVPRAGWFSAPQVQLVAAEWELILGLWLLSGTYRFGAWLAALVTFVGFSGVSGYFGWIGVASCGCFGELRTSPWFVFGFDLVVVRCWRSTGQSVSRHRRT